MTMNREWSLLRVINNTTLLNALIYGEDWHLRHFYRVLSDKEKDEFESLMKDYLKVIPSQPFNEEALDGYMKRLTRLFGGDRGEKWMELHIDVQRACRDNKHRDHIHHLLGVFLLSGFVLQADVDVLTLTRSRRDFYRKIRHLVSKGPPEKYYPGYEERNRYPLGEIFAWALNPTKDKFNWIWDQEMSNKHYYLDAWYWLFLFHDCGYVFELYERLDRDFKNRIDNMVNSSPALKSSIANRNDFINTVISFPFSERKEQLRQAFSSRVEEALKDNDHGVYSALILYGDFYTSLITRHIGWEEFAYADGHSKEDYVRDALCAICLHNIRIKDHRLSVQDSPYYFLLRFVDVISDWSRIFEGRFHYYPVQLLDKVLMGFCPIDLPDDYRGIKWNIVFDFSNSPCLLEEHVGSKDYEIKDFKDKCDELEMLDYTVEINGKRYQWFRFEIVLIDRYGHRFLISNENNTVTFDEMKAPLFK